MKAIIKVVPSEDTPVEIILSTTLGEVRALRANIKENQWPNLQFKCALEAALEQTIVHTEKIKVTT